MSRVRLGTGEGLDFHGNVLPDPGATCGVKLYLTCRMESCWAEPVYNVPEIVGHPIRDAVINVPLITSRPTNYL
jgi:hypothetical protein